MRHRGMLRGGDAGVSPAGPACRAGSSASGSDRSVRATGAGRVRTGTKVRPGRIPAWSSCSSSRSSTRAYDDITCRSKIRYSSSRESCSISRACAAARIARHRACGPSGRRSPSNAGVPASTPKRCPSRCSARFARPSCRVAISCSTVFSSITASSTRLSLPKPPENGAGSEASGAGAGGVRMAASDASSSSMKCGTRSERLVRNVRRVSMYPDIWPGLRAWSASRNSSCSNSSSMRARPLSSSWDTRASASSSALRTRPGSWAAARVRGVFSGRDVVGMRPPVFQSLRARRAARTCRMRRIDLACMSVIVPPCPSLSGSGPPRGGLVASCPCRNRFLGLS